MVDRIKQIIEYSGLSARAFSMKCKVTQSSFSRQLNGVMAINVETINAILHTFPEISSDWLMRGEGEMLKTSGAASTSDEQNISKLIDTIDTLNSIIRSQQDRIKELEEQIRKDKDNNK